MVLLETQGLDRETQPRTVTGETAHSKRKAWFYRRYRDKHSCRQTRVRRKHRAFKRKLILAVLAAPVASPVAYGVILPPNSVTLAWNPSPDADVTGYRVYYGPASGSYTNSIAVGNVTSNTITGLVNGAPYYFAVTAYDWRGMESPFSNEIVYTPGGPGVRLRVAPDKSVVVTVTGTAGRVYDILATQNLVNWTVIGSVTLGASASFDFTDASAANYPSRYYRTRQKF
jgi:hypothetical protein